MAKYRKRPVIIDAVQFLPDRNLWPAGVEADATSPTGYGIFTLEHTARRHEVSPGDWIIRGVEGEIYACKHRIFVATYEPVETP
jgi:hypothetical protein